MRLPAPSARAFRLLAGLLVTAFVLPAEAAGPARTNAAPTRAATEPGMPPHAWLFGTWSGGLFPAPSDMSAERCLSQPVVIFTRDVVLRAVITDQLYDQRLIETARGTPNGVEFRFIAADTAPPASGILGIAPPSAPVGFGCADPNGLPVERRSDNEIMFPGCADFPYPLVRCPSR